MRAIVLSNSQIEFTGEFEPRPANSQHIRVDVITAGICETDLQLKQGYMGFSGVLGHEFVGIARSGRLQGKRVVGEINCACGTCGFCLKKMSRHCPKRSVIGILSHDGAFADSVWVPEENLHAVPDDIPTDSAVFTEPVAAACRILEQVQMGSSDRVVIFGDGRLGNLCAQVLKTTGCQLTVVGKHQWKLERLDGLGIDTCRLSEFVSAADCDFVVDCTGSPSGFDHAMRAVRPCGTIILKTTVAAEQPLHLAPVVIDEVRILGSRCGPFEPALKMIQNGYVQVEQLISARYGLEDAKTAFAHAERPDTLKVLFDVSSDSSTGTRKSHS